MSEIDYSTGALMESINNKVDLDGVQTITGQKIFVVQHDKQLTVRFPHIDTENLPDSAVYGQILLQDVNGKRIGVLESAQYGDGTLRTNLGVTNKNGVHNSFYVSITEDGTKAAHVITPADSSNTTDVATTQFVKRMFSENIAQAISYSRSGTGYIRFSNGIQICWGTVKAGSTATFAKAFSNIWAANLTMVADENAGYQAYIRTLSTTQIKAHRYNNDTSTSCRYMAIGKS